MIEESIMLDIGTKVLIKDKPRLDFHGLRGKEATITHRFKIGTGKYIGYHVDNHTDGIWDKEDFEKIIE